jgi:NAD(P)-dependent dehydrogenase (short-subunit alcohol dehydrogenase family)
VVKTDMTKKFWDAEPFKHTNQEFMLSNRDCTVEDVADAIHFLASSEGSFFNGQTLALDRPSIDYQVLGSECDSRRAS